MLQPFNRTWYGMVCEPLNGIVSNTILTIIVKILSCQNVQETSLFTAYIYCNTLRGIFVSKEMANGFPRNWYVDQNVFIVNFTVYFRRIVKYLFLLCFTVE